MNRDIIPNLCTDPQDQPPASFCPICGGELYLPSLICLRCEGGPV